MSSLRRPLLVLAVLALVAGGLLPLLGSSGGSRGGIREHERGIPFAEREGDRGEGEPGGEAAGPAAEQVANRAYPRAYVESRRALAARRAVLGHPRTLARADFRPRAAGLAAPSLTTPWEQLGPGGVSVPGAVTYTGRASTVSGRVTAMVISPTCVPGDCALWVAAAGGGVWRTDDALAATPAWSSKSTGLTSNAIGSLALDPNDATHRTLYAGTGEPNGSSDSEAGVGLFRSTDGGDHWSLVPGSAAGVALDRSIGAVAIDPADPKHIVIGTALARHGSSSVNGGRRTPPGAPELGVYESTDGGANFRLTLARDPDPTNPATGQDYFTGSVPKVEFDPTHPGILYAAITGWGIYRRGDVTNDGDATTFHKVFATQQPDDATGARMDFDLTTSGTTTRIYVGDTADSGTTEYAKLWRLDDAGVSAATLLNTGTTPTSNVGGWTLLSDSTDAGKTSDAFCQNLQCGYDLFVAAEPGQPDNVWLGGSFRYGDLDSETSNGRAVVRSTDAGVTFRDMTNDARSPAEGMHPDQHAIAFASVGGQTVAFVGSDGGVVRVEGPYTVDDSARCGGTPTGLETSVAVCGLLLKNMPTTITPINDGLDTLQFQSVSVNAANTGDVIGGTQDNGTLARDPGSAAWEESVGGDGGQSVIDVATPSTRMHMYYGSAGDVNFDGMDPGGWYYNTGPLDIASDTRTGWEDVSFYMPLIGDPVTGGTLFAGMSHVWRTPDSGGTETQLAGAHCGESDPVPAPSVAACGDWVPLGGAVPDDPGDLSGDDYGVDRDGGYVVALARARGDSSTLWAATRYGRLFVSKNADAAAAAVTYDRIDTNLTPGRFVSGIVVDPQNANHAWISYSGYGAYTSGQPQHVVEALYDPAAHSATFTDRSYDLGDAPVTGLARDDNGDLYAATDFGVLRLPGGATAWELAGSALPPVAVYGLTLPPGSHQLFAATHGRGAWRLQLPVPPAPAPAPSPPADTTTTPAPAPRPQPLPAVVPALPRLAGTTFQQARDGTIRVTLRCRAGGPSCTGVLRLKGLPRKGRGRVVLAKLSFDIAAGKSATRRVHVLRTRLVKRNGHRRVPAFAMVTRAEVGERWIAQVTILLRRT